MQVSAAQYYRSGEYNCSQCLLMAAKDKYNIDFSNDQIKLCSALSNGFGTGGICCVLVAAIMVFGALFDKEEANVLRIKLLNEFHMRYGNINCGRMKGYMLKDRGCESIIEGAWYIMDSLIQANLK